MAAITGPDKSDVDLIYKALLAHKPSVKPSEFTGENQISSASPVNHIEFPAALHFHCILCHKPMAAFGCNHLQLELVGVNYGTSYLSTHPAVLTNETNLYPLD